MSKEKIDLIIDGGGAVAGAALGQSLGPLRINVKDVINKINEKTSSFKGMKVPVKIIVDKDTKEFSIEVGTPPVSEIIKKELGLEKGSGEPNVNKIGNLAMEQVVKIAKMKKENMLVNSLKAAVKNVVGSCGQMGVLVESKEPKDIVADINNGIYEDIISKENTEITKEKLAELEAGLKRMQEEIKKRIEKEKAEEEKKEVKKVEEAVEEKKEEVKEEKKEVKEEKGVKEEKKQDGKN